MSAQRPAIDAEAMRVHAGDAARLLKALANDKRLMILCLLVEGERSVSELNEQLDLSQSALSQHLAVLREEGLVCTRREAQSIYYSLAPGPVRVLIHTLHAIYCSAGEQEAPR
ncbi:MAG TPA: metalloregulator ArsR/SmtB family transcription factor [Candidatus Competibacteraceae bacterium]|nr:metalloregulator ArsR/SmtB family transcription factor [Candidatus Competibacteraceae bacterium]